MSDVAGSARPVSKSLKWRDIYKAACAMVVRAELDHGKESEKYRQALGGQEDILSMRCTFCVGQGRINSIGNPVAFSSGGAEPCFHCQGSGFQLNEEYVET